MSQTRELLLQMESIRETFPGVQALTLAHFDRNYVARTSKAYSA